MFLLRHKIPGLHSSTSCPTMSIQLTPTRSLSPRLQPISDDMARKRSCREATDTVPVLDPPASSPAVQPQSSTTDFTPLVDSPPSAVHEPTDELPASSASNPPTDSEQVRQPVATEPADVTDTKGSTPPSVPPIASIPSPAPRSPHIFPPPPSSSPPAANQPPKVPDVRLRRDPCHYCDGYMINGIHKDDCLMMVDRTSCFDCQKTYDRSQPGHFLTCAIQERCQNCGHVWDAESEDECFHCEPSKARLA